MEPGTGTISCGTVYPRGARFGDFPIVKPISNAPQPWMRLLHSPRLCPPYHTGVVTHVIFDNEVHPGNSTVRRKVLFGPARLLRLASKVICALGMDPGHRRYPMGEPSSHPYKLVARLESRLNMIKESPRSALLYDTGTSGKKR